MNKTKNRNPYLSSNDIRASLIEMKLKIQNKTSWPVSKISGLLLLTGLLMLSSCKSAKQAQQIKLKERSAKYLLKKLSRQNIDVEWLSAKAKMVFKDETQRKKANANIRLRKDSIIWMNIKKLGVEAARVLITTDSIYIMDRINDQYAVTDFSLIEEQYHLPANFQTLQNVVLGNPLFFSKPEELKASINKEQYHLAGDNEDRVTSDYLLNGISHLLERMLFLDLRYNRKVDIEMGDYKQLEQYPNFSYFRSLNLSSRETGDLSIELSLSKLEINVPKTIRFEIPEHYTKVK